MESGIFVNQVGDESVHSAKKLHAASASPRRRLGFKSHVCHNACCVALTVLVWPVRYSIGGRPAGTTGPSINSLADEASHCNSLSIFMWLPSLILQARGISVQ